MRRSAHALHSLADRVRDPAPVGGHGRPGRSRRRGRGRRAARARGSRRQKTETSTAPECLAAFAIASRAASTRARRRSSSAHRRCARARPGRRAAPRSPRPPPRPRGERAGGARLAVGVEPRAQLALLPPRERRDASRVVRLALDQGERLQHRVVDAGGEVGALLDANAGVALGVALAYEPPRPRHERRAAARSRPRPARAASSPCRARSVETNASSAKIASTVPEIRSARALMPRSEPCAQTR